MLLKHIIINSGSIARYVSLLPPSFTHTATNPQTVCCVRYTEYY